MLLNTIQRFSPDYIFRLKQIGLAFFEKIATDRAIAGETQDFYQGLLAGLDGAVKLIDEESGVQTLSLLEAKIATFINDEEDIAFPIVMRYSSNNEQTSYEHLF
jgi:hypothetical protein